MRAIPIIILTFLLMACSGGMGGAPGGGGSLDNSGGGPVGGNGSAAQPLDPGFSGPGKDVNNLNYAIRDAKGQVLCKETSGDYRVKLSGLVYNDQTQLPVGGFLRISDRAAQRFQVTRASIGSTGEVGTFSTKMTLRTPFEVFFAMMQTSEEPPLEILQPFGSDMVFVIAADPTPPLVIEGTGNSLPCVGAANSTLGTMSTTGDSDSEEVHFDPDHTLDL